MTRPMIALHRQRMVSEAQASRRDRLIGIAIRCVERAMNGPRTARIVHDVIPVIGTARLRTSFHYDGPRGGRAVVVAVMGTAPRDDDPLELAAEALEAMVAPRWTRDDRIQVELVARACALLAHDAAPHGTMWAGFPGGPTGAFRSEATTNPVPDPWAEAVDLGLAVIAECPPSISVDIDTPRDHGRVPHMVTLSQNHALLNPPSVAKMTPMDRLRYAQLARLP